jgi:hypothetical protein
MTALGAATSSKRAAIDRAIRVDPNHCVGAVVDQIDQAGKSRSRPRELSALFQKLQRRTPDHLPAAGFSPVQIRT